MKAKTPKKIKIGQKVWFVEAISIDGIKPFAAVQRSATTLFLINNVDFALELEEEKIILGKVMVRVNSIRRLCVPIASVFSSEQEAKDYIDSLSPNA